MALVEFKCPNCGGEISYSANKGKMTCPYCDSEFSIKTVEEYNESLKDEIENDISWTLDTEQFDDEEVSGLRTYICKSCGGEIIGDDNMGATVCPFCGNNIVISEKFSGSLRPDLVIPFKKTKKDAKEALIKHYKNKVLLPAVFKDDNHLDEIKGIYIPFWLFDGEADVDIRYKGIKNHYWSDSHYDYHEKEYYAIRRSGSVAFEQVPVDGSSKIANELMESIEPFDYTEAVDFKTAYLAGYLAEKYDVEANECEDIANDRIKNSSLSAFESTINGYDSKIPEHLGIRLRNGKVHYALYPVWFLNTTYKDKQYTFVMNGQTGKFIGNMPTDLGKLGLYAVSIFMVVTIIVFAIMYLVWVL